MELRERKKAETRRAIQEQALTLFGRHGYADVTVEAISAAAGVSVRTFYRYFASKDEVIFAPWDGWLDVLRHTLRNRDRAVEPRESICAAMKSVASAVERERDVMMRLTALASDNPPLHVRRLQEREKWTNAIADELAMQAGVAKDDMRVRVLAGVMFAGYLAAVDEWRKPANRTSLPDLLDASMRVACDAGAGVLDLFRGGAEHASSAPADELRTAARGR